MAMLSKRKWPVEEEALREMLRGFPFTEEMKWGKPCFSLDGKNVVLLQGFNEYIALMFFKGALLKDAKKRLSTPGEHQSVRQLRFVTVAEIAASEKVVKAYVAEAIEVERAGLKVKLKKSSEYAVPEELERRFAEMPPLKKAFQALTPGRQKYYLLHIAGAKQAKTREARVEACVPRILAGLGMMEWG
jgi:uncharacterized protein YdeI (YjbR/CyaY-like superfamily)